MKTDIISAILFVGLVVIAGWAIWLGRHECRRQRGVRVFLVYMILASTGAGALHRELWPFSRWQLFAYRYTPPVEVLQIRAVDAHGTEYDIDRRAWEPLSSLELQTWIGKHLLSLNSTQRAAVGRYLLEMVNRARERAATGESLGVFGRFFGPLHAPLHIVHAPIWSAPGALPPASFTGLRVYLDRWDVMDRARDPGHVQRTLLYAYDRS